MRDNQSWIQSGFSWTPGCLFLFLSVKFSARLRNVLGRANRLRNGVYRVIRKVAKATPMRLCVRWARDGLDGSMELAAAFLSRYLLPGNRIRYEEGRFSLVHNF